MARKGFGFSRYKLLYIEWINSKVLLYSTRDYIQYPVINHNGKEYICITESVCCPAEIKPSIVIFFYFKRLTEWRGRMF